MDIRRFRDLVDRCGEDPEGWPEDVRAAACAFGATDPEAVKVMREARDLRRVMRADCPVKAPADLAGRLFDRLSKLDPDFDQKDNGQGN